MTDEFTLSHETARMMGLKRAKAMEYIMRGEGHKIGVAKVDFKCDADSGQNLDDAMRIYEQNK